MSPFIAEVALLGTLGKFAGETALICSLAAGTVTDDEVKWSSSSAVDLGLEDNYDVMTADVDTFTLKIKETRPSDLMTYYCRYGLQTASYALTHTVLQGTCELMQLVSHIIF